jgi:hypothetical protein
MTPVSTFLLQTSSPTNLCVCVCVCVCACARARAWASLFCTTVSNVELMNGQLETIWNEVVLM